MPKSTYASVVLDVDPETHPLPVEPQSDTAFRILVLGDFSGRANRAEPPPDRLTPHLIDRDNFDDVLARIRPALHLGPPGRALALSFRELEDFHPDRIYAQDVFTKLRATGRLPAPAAPAPVAPPPDLPAFTSGSLLDSVLETTEGRPAPRPRDPLRDFVERAVAPHTAPRQDPRIAADSAAAAGEAGKLMRAVLHHADFQNLEAAWRALHWLVRRLETGPLLKVYALDISKAGLAAKMPQLRRLLVDDASGNPWTLAVANFAFAQTANDVAMLAELASIMRAAGTVLLAEADPSDADSQEAARLWQALRHAPAATSVGLALPRFLLRLPYGAKTDTVESFPFEEMPGAPEHREYLWGNPAFACACLLGQAFSRDGWDLRPGTHTEIAGLPLHVYESNGEPQLKPCAEVLLTESAADSILAEGCMPLVSVKDRDAARLIRFQSIAQPLAPLSGAWT